MQWPNTLPIPLAAGYSVNDNLEVIRPADNLGFAPNVRRRQINPPKTINTGLLLSFDEFAVFDYLLTRKLRNGAIWITMPLTFDNGIHEQLARIVTASPAVEGLHWKVSMNLETMTIGNPTRLAG